MEDFYINYYILLSIIVFIIGLIGVLIRKNIIIILMSIEIMINAVNLLLITFSYIWNNFEGQVFVLFTMFIAAIEIAIGLSIVVAIHKKQNNIIIQKTKYI